jgi:plasmid stabilization system protein ParE
MSRPVILRPVAEGDVQETFRYLEEIQVGLGLKFATSLREALQRIESMPEMYGYVWQDVRAVRVRKFRYVIYYVVFDDRMEVLAVLHGSRRESTWRTQS